jgi:hypothetical protein
MTRRLKITLGITALLVLILALITVSMLAGMFAGDWPGGMSGGTPANDPRVVAQAKSASPIANAIKKYFSAHAAYPARLGDIQSDLPAGLHITSGDYADGWQYIPAPNAKGFSLWQRLGWDPSLEYQWDGHADTWIFHPGDGSADKMVVP